jgi:CRISPR-associated protein Cas5h
MEILVFDIWGDYAHFKRRYTTTSPLTHLIPPKTTIAGIIGAIAGVPRNQYLNAFQDSQVALQILNPIKKTRIPINLIKTKSEALVSPPLVNYFTQHIIVSFEFLKDVKYRLYFYHPDKQLYQKIKTLLAEHKSVYTPTLGLSQLICNFSFCGEYKAIQKKPDSMVNIASVIPMKKSSSDTVLTKIEPEEGKKYAVETVPRLMNIDREVTEYIEILLEESGQKIKALPEIYWEVDNGVNVVPF